jgi:hypothetical protein
MFHSKIVRRFYGEKPMRNFGHKDPVDKHHAPVEVCWLKQLRRQLKRAMKPSGDEYTKVWRQNRATIIKQKMVKLQVAIGMG